jgi:hypothetical protein
VPILAADRVAEKIADGERSICREPERRECGVEAEDAASVGAGEAWSWGAHTLFLSIWTIDMVSLAVEGSQRGVMCFGFVEVGVKRKVVPGIFALLPPRLFPTMPWADAHLERGEGAQCESGAGAGEQLGGTEEPAG